MKTNQDGGSYSAKKSSAPAKELAANQKGAAKYGHHKGAADYSVEKGSHDHPHGASRMGYTQSFDGPARKNCYQKGASRVMDIMTNGGAARYKKYGAANAGHGGSAGHTHDPVDGSSAKFSADDETGAKLTTTTTTTPNVDNSQVVKKRKSGSPEFSAAFANARKSGLDTFSFNGKSYNTNLAKKQDPKPKPQAPTTTVNTIDEDPNSKNQIKRTGLAQKQSLVGQLNMKRYANEMQAVKDSTSANNSNFEKLIAANSNNLTPQTMSYIQRHSANEGNKAANQTRQSTGLPLVNRSAGTHDQRIGSINVGESTVPLNQYWTVDGKVDKSKTTLLPNKKATFKRSAPLYIPDVQ